ncbi:MAG: lysophospholipase [Acidobacteria bacterium]|nr:lysophospholipase [Acidobacteriota bacterium]MCI0621780.1 lysophospholipase [Acidobacteriota bacterium]MCI0719289.1 lysophospholipase [Acidobacteriota bacterium]
MLTALKLLLVGLIAFCVILPFFYSFANVYRPKMPVRSTPQADGLKFEPVSFSTSDGETLRGWFIYGSNGAALVVVCHGLGTNREDVRGVSRFLCQAGFNVLAFDFRAHGESTGYKTTFGFREALDIQAAVQYARERHPQQFKGIGVYAISMGTAAALLAARHLPEVEAFVFDSPFARLSDLLKLQFNEWPHVLRRIFAKLAGFYGALLMGTQVDSIAPEDYVQYLGSRPMLVFHGDQDALIPIAQGKQLFQKVSSPKEFMETPGAAHVQSYTVMGKVYEARVIGFFRHHLRSATDATPPDSGLKSESHGE